MKHSSGQVLFPGFPLFAGMLGFGLRCWLFSAEDRKGLLPENHIAGILSIVLLALTVAICLIGVRKASASGTYNQLFPSSYFALIGSVVSAIGIGYSAFLEKGSSPASLLLLSLGLLSCAALLFAAYCRYKGKQPNCLLYGVVAVFMILRTLVYCRVWGSESQLQLYLFQLLSSICLLIACYYRAELAANSGNCRRYVFFSQVTIFCCCLCLPFADWVFYLSAGLWMATDFCVLPSPESDNSQGGMTLPQSVAFCLQELENAGFEAYAVGGCVRDALLGNPPHDYDLCTSATPEEIVRIFDAFTLVRSGEKHGTIGVAVDQQVIEITTFRTEGGYQDGRHPDWVAFVPDLKEDLARRDFTINAMAYHPQKGYVDPFGGLDDLKNGILRTVGDPRERFTEDALRILRGVRFAVRFQLTPDAATMEAMKELAPTIDKLARERVFDELCKLLPLVTAQDLIHYADILSQAVPVLKPCIGFDQRNPHHAYDVFGHTAYVVAGVGNDLALRWAALLHDCGKPDCLWLDDQGIGHFTGHAKISAQLADAALQQLKAPTALREEVCLLIEQHMSPIEPDKRQLRRKIGKFGQETLAKMIQLQCADFYGKGDGEETDAFQNIYAALKEVLSEEACLSLRDLQINGSDLQALGFAPGPAIGECLNWLLEQVQDEQLPNEKSALTAAATEYQNR